MQVINLMYPDIMEACFRQTNIQTNKGNCNLFYLTILIFLSISELSATNLQLVLRSQNYNFMYHNYDLITRNCVL